ncbi:MAG TPA: alpha-N-arabinofuranosidase [Acidobacteriaceae bacterium]|jgi:alpha-N-arabinofuranosidase|nr:alpha-N-arabinofuranosidase [Acidobacteriaceae bacterium]
MTSSTAKAALLAAATLGTAWAATPGATPAVIQDHSAQPPAAIVARIDAQQTAPPVSKYEFGMFIEHIGPLIYRSLWSEMLDDRKFWFPITAQEPEAPARQGGGFRGMQLRKWRPVGSDNAVTLDADHPFVGDHSPRIALDAATPHGIEQTGLSLVHGKKYTGHIWLRATPGSKVQAALIWGAGDHNRQTLSFAPLTETWKKFPLTFAAGADTSTATLAITGTGTGAGNFHIGTASLMPADNVDGFRPDTIALLKQLHSGFWRLPGGNFLSNWSWYQGVGDRDKRPPMFDHAWNAMQSNDVGLDEFMTLCKLIGTEPYITVNAGFGDAHSAGEEVEYINGSVQTRLGAERARNGHPQPYRIRFWDIGNEPYGEWQLGRTDLKYYVLKHNEFARAMRAADPTITLLASGNMPEPMDLTGTMRAQDIDNMKALEGTPEDWTGGLLKDCWGNFAGITQHWYAQPGHHFDVEKAKRLPLDAPTAAGYDEVQQSPLEFARYPANIVHLKAQEWRRYQQRFPQMVSNKTFLSIDEYAYFGGAPGRGGTNLKLALAYGMIFNEMLRHTDFLTMSAHTMGVSTMDYTPTAAAFNTTGLMFKLYGDAFEPGSIPVELTGNAPQPAPKFPIGGDQPETNSGSPTYPLDMFAALSPDRKFLTLAVINATDKETPFTLDVTGLHLAAPAKVWTLTGTSLDSADRVGQPPQVRIIQTSLDHPHTITAAPISVTVYRFPLAEQ